LERISPSCVYMCNRHFEVRADGLIVVQNSTSADLEMRLLNFDGSETEISGNGLRCFARYATEKGLLGKMSSRTGQSDGCLTIETLSGVRKVKAHMWRNKVNRAQVNMALPRLQPEQIPVPVKVDIIPILDYPLLVDGKKLTLFILFMGNPHVVSFSSQPVADFPLTEIGPKVERYIMFPQRTNFEVARVLGRRR
jgi:diaminopimelate epimerase